jgi:predicted nuclease of predicted toxin-antitoxin system
MIKLLIDENIPPAIVEFLGGKGFDVLYARECELSGKGDSEIIALARDQGRTLVTFDKHFANVLLYPLNSHYGIIRIRIHPPVISDIVKALEHLMRNFDLNTIDQTLIVLERDGFRVRTIR